MIRHSSAFDVWIIAWYGLIIGRNYMVLTYCYCFIITRYSCNNIASLVVQTKKTMEITAAYSTLLKNGGSGCLFVSWSLTLKNYSGRQPPIIRKNQYDSINLQTTLLVDWKKVQNLILVELTEYF